MVGTPEREIQVNVDPYKMTAARVSFTDIGNAIGYENNDVTGGLIEVGNMKRTLKVNGQFKNAQDLYNIVVRSSAQGATVYLRDIAQIKDTIKEKESYARLDGKNVVTLNIVKRAGENLINCANKVKAAVEEMQKNQELPKDLKVVITGDQSKQTATSFNELINTIIIGFILVLIILMFFMGVTNAFFVALSVPLSVFVAFLFLPIADACNLEFYCIVRTIVWFGNYRRRCYSRHREYSPDLCKRKNAHCAKCERSSWRSFCSGVGRYRHHTSTFFPTVVLERSYR